MKITKNIDRLTDFALDSFGIANPLEKGKVCPTCRRLYTEKEEMEFIEDIGECGTCDHVRGEVLDDQHSEAVKNWDGETDQDKWTTDAYLER